MLKMNHIDIFNNSEIIIKKRNYKIDIYNIVLLIVLGLMFVLICFYKYTPYFNIKASVILSEQDYYLKILVLENNIENINNNELIINNRTYKYKIKYISDEYLVDQNYNKYYEVFIECKIDKSLQINNNIIDINIKQPKITYLKKITQELRKGKK